MLQTAIQPNHPISNIYSELTHRKHARTDHDLTVLYLQDEIIKGIRSTRPFRLLACIIQPRELFFNYFKSLLFYCLVCFIRCIVICFSVGELTRFNKNICYLSYDLSSY